LSRGIKTGVDPQWQVVQLLSGQFPPQVELFDMDIRAKNTLRIANVSMLLMIIVGNI